MRRGGEQGAGVTGDAEELGTWLGQHHLDPESSVTSKSLVLATVLTFPSPFLYPQTRPLPQTCPRQRVCLHLAHSGESGAGKTESTKLILQNFTALSSKHSLIQEQIIEASPIMEAFGNAKTVRNDNSSRFGKFIEVQFGPDGTIQGARILDYLLERSRIVHQSTDERNYHIFYCLLSGATKDERSALRLTNAEQYAYLNQSGCVKVPKIDDVADFEKVRSAMKLLKFGDNERAIFEVLAAVLHIGNFTFRKVENANVAGDAADFVDKPGLEEAGSADRHDRTGPPLTLTVRVWAPLEHSRDVRGGAAGRRSRQVYERHHHAQHDAAQRDDHVAPQHQPGSPPCCPRA